MAKEVMRFLCFLSLFIFAGTAFAADMRFTLQERDLRPDFDLDQWIFADGEIVPGTFDKFQSFVKAHPSLIADATVVLNSPGGSVAEGIKLGDAIRELHFRTDVGTAGDGPMSTAPGLCLSACIYPYLGGEYRYLHEGSAIGVHRFSFTGTNISGTEAAETSQLLAGHIV
jgi:ATP-dependent protease ClpP protease subunit